MQEPNPIDDPLARAIRDCLAQMLGVRLPGEEILAVLATDAFLRLPQVMALSGLSMPQLYRLMEQERFPKSVAIGQSSRAWLLSEVKAWQAERKAERDTGADAHLRVANPNIGKGRPKHRASGSMVAA
jgi:prophage regulatory protein